MKNLPNGWGFLKDYQIEEKKEIKKMNQEAAAIQQEMEAAQLDGMMSGQGVDAFAGMMGG